MPYLITEKKRCLLSKNQRPVTMIFFRFMQLFQEKTGKSFSLSKSFWDILIVLDKDKLTPEDYDTITYPLTKLGWDLGAEINPIMYTKKEWEASRITPFYHNVTEDAIALWV